MEMVADNGVWIAVVVIVAFAAFVIKKIRNKSDNTGTGTGGGGAGGGDNPKNNLD